MKNRVMSIVFILLIILLMVSIFNGIKIGNFQILSVSELVDKNNQLNEKIQTASSLTSVDYPEAIATLEETYEKHTLQKKKYEEISGFSSEDNNEIYETKQYDIAYLWRTIGKYATSRNLTIGMEVKKGTGQDLYDLYFTVSGQYVNISQFITDIENNSNLYFRIYNFKMSGSSETVSSTFTVKDIKVDSSTLITVTNSNDSEIGQNSNDNVTTDAPTGEQAGAE